MGNVKMKKIGIQVLLNNSANYAIIPLLISIKGVSQ